MRAFAIILLLLAFRCEGQRLPVLSSGDANYPPIARAAHVSGDAQVTFHIQQDGSTSDVVEGPGPPMLVTPLARAVAQWRFQTPLPVGSPTNWTAEFHYGVNDSDEDELNDAVDGPPWYPCCGDVIMMDPAATTVRGKLRGDTGAEIVWQPSPASTPKPCEAKATAQPSGSDLNDFIELDRRTFYKVRVYRGGRVEWLGVSGVDAFGPRQGALSSSEADTLFKLFGTVKFWSRCGITAPPERNAGGDPDYGQFLTARFGDAAITLHADDAPKEAWALESATDTHQWRHGDPATELPRNMNDDLHTPKPGITALMRAVDHYNRFKAQWSDAALKYQLARTPDIEAVDASGWTALAYAAALHSGCCDHNPAVSLLLAAHASVDHSSFHGDTPLMLAAYFGNLNEDLLKVGADINHRNADGVTTLMLLAQQQRFADIEAALQAGADPTAKDALGRSSLDYFQAAACNRTVVPLPIPEMTVETLRPEECQVTREEYKAIKSVLEAAMKHSRPH